MKQGLWPPGRTEVHKPGLQLRKEIRVPALCVWRRENQVRSVSLHAAFTKPTTTRLTLPEHFYQQVKSDLITKQGHSVSAVSPKDHSICFPYWNTSFYLEKLSPLTYLAWDTCATNLFTGGATGLGQRVPCCDSASTSRAGACSVCLGPLRRACEGSISPSQ